MPEKSMPGMILKIALAQKEEAITLLSASEERVRVLSAALKEIAGPNNILNTFQAEAIARQALEPTKGSE